MFFSVYGPASIPYQIRIWCDGIYIDTQPIFVTSTVAKVSYFNQPPYYFNLDASDFSDFNFMIKIEDKNGKGIQGKIPLVYTRNAKTREIFKPKAAAIMFNATIINPSDNEGIVQVSFDFGFSSQSDGEMEVFFESSVDDVDSDFSDLSYLIDKIKDPNNCGIVYLSDYENIQ